MSHTPRCAASRWPALSTAWRRGRTTGSGHRFSPDGARLMYPAEQGKRFAIVVDGTPEGDYSRAPMAYDFSPDGERYAYVTVAKRALRGERWCCVVDGVPGPEFDGIESRPVFSEHGEHLAYVARRGDERFAVVDGSPELPLERAYYPSFSAAGRLAYLGFDSLETVAVITDGRGGPTSSAWRARRARPSSIGKTDRRIGSRSRRTARTSPTRA